MKADFIDRKLPPRAAAAFMLFGAVCWSLSGALIKLLDWNAFVIAGVRSALAALVLMLFLKAVGRRLVLSKTIFLIGIAVSMKYVTFVTGNKLTAAANVIALQYTSPVFVLLFSYLFLHQKPRRKDVIVSFFAIFGVALLVCDQFTAQGMLGNLLALGCGIATAVMYLTTGKLASYEESISVIIVGHAITTAFTLPFLAIYPPVWSLKSVGILLLLGVVQQGIAYICYSLAIRSSDPVTCSVIAAVEPLLNPVWVFLMVGELPGPIALLGAAVVLASLTGWSVSDVLAAKKQAEKP